MLDHVARDLSLSNAQRVAVDSIFQRTDSSLRAIRLQVQPELQRVFEQGRVEINARLDSAQRAKFAARHTPRGAPGEWR